MIVGYPSGIYLVACGINECHRRPQRDFLRSTCRSGLQRCFLTEKRMALRDEVKM